MPAKNKLGPNAEYGLHLLFEQTLIDLEHHLTVHAAFDHWLAQHNKPSECSEPAIECRRPTSGNRHNHPRMTARGNPITAHRSCHPRLGAK